MIYTATITTASLRLRESRIVAALLLKGVDADEWKRAVYEENALHLRSPESIKRVSGLLRARLEPLGKGLWEMVRSGDRELATQATFAGAVKNSRLLGDFMDIVIRDHRATFTQAISPTAWEEYIAGCRGRDPDMPHWSEKTVAKLRSRAFHMLAEAGYLQSTRNLVLQTVFVDPRLSEFLSQSGEGYVLRCLEVTE